MSDKWDINGYTIYCIALSASYGFCVKLKLASMVESKNPTVFMFPKRNEHQQDFLNQSEKLVQACMGVWWWI